MLQCTNCRCDLRGAEVYRAIILCLDCFKVALRKEETIDHELRGLKVAAIECIRNAAASGKLLLNSPPMDNPPNPGAIVQSLVNHAQ